ncbi:MAG: phosphoenolpyruvate--protein phosphotransferase [Lachnospiraceae bacterium]|nr:phosphoenolpyruvate--protein phosphotransferase [Lachnospiraceae bacterium]
MKGTVAVSGKVLAKAYLIKKQRYQTQKQQVDCVEEELQKLEVRKKKCQASLERLIEQLQNSTDAQSAEILDFQLLLLEDHNYMGKIQRMIKQDHVNCEYAISESSECYRQELAALDNAYLNERVGDIYDLEQRLLGSLEEDTDKQFMSEPSIVIAEDLTPSQVAEYGKQNLRGIILEKGGLSSHCVILARSMDIPCMIGVEGILKEAAEKVSEDTLVYLDAVQGEICLSPDHTAIEAYETYRKKKEEEDIQLENYRKEFTRTQDGKSMKVYGNISSRLEIEELLKQGGEGIGLFRTEILYMENPQEPDEDSQFAVYAEIVRTLGNRPVIIRTLDVGGDKKIPYLHIPEEENPFLGYRAIRYCLDHEELYRKQIAAILRASTCGNVQIMLPMISTLSEVEHAKEFIGKVKEALIAEHRDVRDVQVGIMIETPAAAIMADKMAEHVDFFSIGTNDLTQYLYAADRNNANVAYLNSYYNPALLRMMRYVVESAHKHHIEVDICGQAGEVEELIPIWVGMGIDNLSVSVPSIPKVRRMISHCNPKSCQQLLDQVIQLETDREVEDVIREEVSKW